MDQISNQCKFLLLNRSYFNSYILGVYIAEIAEPSLRRTLGPFKDVGRSVGFLLGYTTSAFVPWRMCKLILGSLITLPAAFLILLCNETPHWLVKNSMLDNARYEVNFLSSVCPA